MTDDEGARRLLALCSMRGVNWNVIAREAQRPGGLDRLLRAELVVPTPSAAEKHAVLQTRETLEASLPRLDEHLAAVDADLAAAARVDARLVTVLDDDYPPNLRLVFDLPPFLYYRGELRREDTTAVAVVGTREASEDGLALAREMAKGLAKEGVTIVSGLARGIDTAAHTATLDVGGRTMAVLGHGIARPVYPAENADLAERIARHGAVVSQFPPDRPPGRDTFPRRNVVTSGISQGTVVVEATSTSGAKMQARLALQHGKQVFLVDSLVTDQQWARKYLTRGAVKVDGVDDVLRYLQSPDTIDARVDDRRQLALDFS